MDFCKPLSLAFHRAWNQNLAAKNRLLRKFLFGSQIGLGLINVDNMGAEKRRKKHDDDELPKVEFFTDENNIFYEIWFWKGTE